ncbi:15323_t:CDS:1, partial [Funneliformis geosporum]
MHVEPITNTSHRTILTPCTRCIYHNPLTKIPPQTKDSDNRCFFTIPRDLCFFIPTLRNNSVERFPWCSWSRYLLRDLAITFINQRNNPHLRALATP